MKLEVDIAVIGSGFSGSLTAMIARRLGYSVALVEKGTHPRFAIGESSTPLANLLLEDLSARYDLPRLLPLAKWGTWQRNYPELTVGLKRGFTFYHHTAGAPFSMDAGRRNQLLVGASPHDGIADTHWYRADFDAFLLREAENVGVVYLDRVELQSIQFKNGTGVLHGRRTASELRIRSRFIIDGSGPRGYLHRALRLPERTLEKMPRTAGLFTHFNGVKRWADLQPDADKPPYPPDDAALHHIFEGGWIWVLRFNSGATSAGAALTHDLAKELNLTEKEAAWRRLLERLPSVGEQFAEAAPVQPWVVSPQLSFLSGQISGRGWALLPSAAGFIDPLLSTGFPLALLGIERLGRLLEEGLDAPHLEQSLDLYSRRTAEELLTVEQLTAALYAAMGDPELFWGLSRLYFAATSFTETARRLERPELSGSAFLLRNHRLFGPGLESCTRHALRLSRKNTDSPAREELLEQISKTIQPVDVAGLTDNRRRNWHPVRAEDLTRAADLLKASPEEIKRLLSRSGF